MAAPVLNGVTLPEVTNYQFPRVLQGSTSEMADGTIVVDVVAPGLIGDFRTIWELNWVLITSSELTTIENAYTDLVTNGVRVFAPPEGGTYNVQVTKDVEFKPVPVKVAGGLKYNVSFKVKQIS